MPSAHSENDTGALSVIVLQRTSLVEVAVLQVTAQVEVGHDSKVVLLQVKEFHDRHGGGRAGEAYATVMILPRNDDIVIQHRNYPLESRSGSHRMHHRNERTRISSHNRRCASRRGSRVK